MAKHARQFRALPLRHFLHFSELKMALKGRRLNDTTMINVNHGTLKHHEML